jgi:GDSL-like Lipase/Acylhydrolase family
MKPTKRAALGLLLTIVTATSLSVISAPAYASSDYDSILQVTPTLDVYTDGATKSTTMDISATWWSAYKEAYALRVAQNIGWPTDFVTKFESYMTSGGSWGVYETENTNGYVITIVATDDPNATCSFGGDISTGYYGCWASAGYGVIQSNYFTHNSYGGNGCLYGTICSSDGMGIYGAPSVTAPSGSGHWAAVISNTNPVVTKVFVWNFHNEYPTGYAGAILPTHKTATALSYVAMGDSFSSGEGDQSYFDATNIGSPIENRCHRSPDAYPVLLSEDFSLDLNLTGFIACSGATTSDVLTDGQYNEDAQIDHLGGSPDVVTISIGGNDMGFVTYATACVIGDCSDSSAAYATAVAKINALDTPLEDTYNAILSDLSVDGDLYVVDYPMLVPKGKEFTDPIDPQCVYLHNGQMFEDELVDPWGNGMAVEDIIARLNAKIELVVYDISLTDSRIHFVDVSAEFEGHDVCSSDPYFVSNYLDAGAFHPTEEGHQVMADILSGVFG